jgi:hypothetical protein
LGRQTPPLQYHRSPAFRATASLRLDAQSAFEHNSLFFRSVHPFMAETLHRGFEIPQFESSWLSCHMTPGARHYNGKQMKPS